MVGLRIEDLPGEKLVVVELLSFKRTRRKDVYILEVEYEGDRYRVGVVGDDVLKSILKLGWKEDGKIYLKLPQRVLRHEIGWLNTPIVVESLEGELEK